MTQYYKGSIINNSNLPQYGFNLNIIETNIKYKHSYYVLDNSSHESCLYFRKKSSSDLKNLVELLDKTLAFKINDDEKNILDKEIINAFQDSCLIKSGYPIVYEKIYDQNGFVYGKEIITGAIFPINLKYSSFIVDYKETSLDKVYYNLDNNKGYTIKQEYNNHGGFNYFIVDFFGNEYRISHDDYCELDCLWDSWEKNVYFDHKCYTFVMCKRPVSYNITLIPKIFFPPNQKVDFLIGNECIASELEVKEYMNRFEKGFGKQLRKKKIEKIINDMSLSNNLGDITLISNNTTKEKTNESNITKEMQELEFLLFKLKSISKEDYDTLNQEYLEILNQDENGLHLKSLSINTIISLQNRAKLYYICKGGKVQQIIEYLKDEVGNYLENYRNDSKEKTELSLNDLDKLCDYFLNSKDSYPFKEQNEVLRCISLLYFFEILENKDIITANDLDRSYASNNIKRILVIIDCLYDVGIIKGIPTNIYDINNSNELLDFIKKIDFADKTDFSIIDGPSLIKKLQQ